MVSYNDVSSVLKDIRGLIQKSKDAELINRSLDLQRYVSEVMAENDDLKHENKKLKDEVADLNQKKLDRSELRKFKNFWVATPRIEQLMIDTSIPYSDNYLQFSYCPKCLAKDNKLVSLNSRYLYGNIYNLYCPVCGFSTNIK